MTEKDLKLALETIAANAKHFRQLKGLTQEDMADFGFDYRFYQRVESGKHSMSLYTVVRLASAFDVLPFEMLKPLKKIKKK